MKKRFLLIGIVVMLCLLISVLVRLSVYDPNPMAGQPVFREDQEILTVVFDSIINNHGRESVSYASLDEVVNWLRQFTVGRKLRNNESLPSGSGSIEVTVTYADGSQQTTSVTHVLIDGEQYEINRPTMPDAVPSLD